LPNEPTKNKKEKIESDELDSIQFKKTIPFIEPEKIDPDIYPDAFLNWIKKFNKKEDEQ